MHLPGLFLVFAFLCCCHPLFAQRDGALQRLELLKKEIRKSTYFDSAKVFSNGEKAIALSRELHAPVEEGMIYLFYGNFYYNSRKLQKATYYYNKALQIAARERNGRLRNSVDLRFAFILSEKNKDAAEQRIKALYNEAKRSDWAENQIEACNGMGVICQQRMLTERALSWYYRGLRVAEKSHSNRFVALILNNIGLLKLQTKQLQAAREDLERSLSIAENEGDNRMTAILVNNLGQTTFELKDYNSAVKHYRKSLELNRRQGFPAQLAASYINLAHAYTLNKQYASAKPLADSGVVLSRQIQQYDFLGQAYYVEGLIAASTNHIPDAWKYIDTIESIEKQTPFAQNYLSVFDLKSVVAEKQHNFEDALRFKTQFFEKSDSVSNKMNLKVLAEMQLLYGREQADAQLSREKVRNSLLVKDKQLQFARIKYSVMLIIGILLLAVAFFYVRAVRLKRRREQLFTRQLIEQIDRERIRISKDLHDDIGQLLSVVKSRVNMYNAGRIDTIEGLDKDIGEVIEHTREISHNLHPSTLEKFGLASSLESLAEKTRESSGLFVTVNAAVETQLPMETKSQLYRIAQESINNTLKHSEASAIAIQFAHRDGTWQFDYRDNGRGVDEEAIRNGFGFMTMRERTRAINGKMTVESDSETGIHISIRFE